MFRHPSFALMTSVLLICTSLNDAFTLSTYGVTKQQNPTKLFMSSFAADGSEYSSKKDDYVDDELQKQAEYAHDISEEDSTETVEQKPVPMSKNAGNRFVAIVWDKDVDTSGKDASELHLDRDKLVEDHVMFCRKRNLYNETFNSDSMVDILKSLPILSSDLKRVVGHTLILESPDISHVKEMLQEEPILQMLNGGDISEIPLFRWRQIRDYTLRIDDGRFGYPCMMIAVDEDPESFPNNIRQESREENLKYLIKSNRIIAAGPLHMPTEIKNDPSSIPIGDFILFNAKNREDAIEFVEESPFAAQGLYKELRVHFYNTLDVTGKFVSEDPMRDAPGYQMKEAMDYWGYPVEDNQTPWLNW